MTERVRPVQHEWSLQRTCHVFLSKALPPDCYYSAIDIGSAGSARQGMLRKARGIKAGIADTIIVYRNVTLWLELKVGASLSEAQKMFRDQITANGHLWQLCRSPEEVEAACRSAGIPLRATLGEIRGRIEAQNERLPPPKKRSPRKAAGRTTVTVAQAHKMRVWG